MQRNTPAGPIGVLAALPVNLDGAADFCSIGNFSLLLGFRKKSAVCIIGVIDFQGFIINCAAV
jgi:hypothetical protein